MDTYYLDYTTLAAWRKCRLAGWIRYGLGYTRPSGGLAPKPSNLKLLWGTAAHEAVASWLMEMNTLAALAAFERVYRPAVAIPPEDDRYTWENSRDVMAAWLYSQRTNPMLFQPYHAWVESHLETSLTTEEEAATLGYQIIWVSRPDAVGGLPTLAGHYTLETKTTGQHITAEDWIAQWEKDTQLTSQIWTVGQVTGEVPAGAFVNAIQVTRLPSGPTQCTRGKDAHRVPYDQCRLAHAKYAIYGPFLRSPEALDTWRREAVALGQEFIHYHRTYRLEHVAWVPEDGAWNAGGACRFCEFAGWCAGGKDPGLLHSGGYDPWNPRLGAKGLRATQKGTPS